MTGHDDHFGDLEMEALVAQALDRQAADSLSHEQLLALIGDELSENERGVLVDRLIADGESLDRLKALRPMRDWSQRAAAALEAEIDERPAARAPARNRARVRRIWALAAALLAVLGLSLVMPRLVSTPSPPTVLRAQLPSAALMQPLDGAILDQAPEYLEWNVDLAAGSRGSVLLFDVESALLWRSPATVDSRVVLPEQVRAQLRPGQRYFWRLSIDDGLDQRLLPLAGFEIQP